MQLVSFTFTDYTDGIRGLDVGVKVWLPIKLIPEALRSLGNLEGEEVEARVFKYVDPEQEPVVLPERNVWDNKLEQIAPMQAGPKLWKQ